MKVKKESLVNLHTVFVYDQDSVVLVHSGYVTEENPPQGKQRNGTSHWTPSYRNVNQQDALGRTALPLLLPPAL